MPFQVPYSPRFESAIKRFDEENSRDPKRIEIEGTAQPYELIYSQWLTDWVLKLAPSASEELRLAARSQHLCRWMLPREQYPMTRTGYLQWRETLKKFHAQKTGEILHELGYPEDLTIRVQSLNLKKNFPNDPEGRILEDALCLVFLEHQFTELASKTSEEKMIGAVQKTWKKMTPKAQSIALTLSFTPSEKALIEKALSGPSE